MARGIDMKSHGSNSVHHVLILLQQLPAIRTFIGVVRDEFIRSWILSFVQNVPYSKFKFFALHLTPPRVFAGSKSTAFWLDAPKS